MGSTAFLGNFICAPAGEFLKLTGDRALVQTAGSPVALAVLLLAATIRSNVKDRDGKPLHWFLASPNFCLNLLLGAIHLGSQGLGDLAGKAVLQQLKSPVGSNTNIFETVKSSAVGYALVTWAFVLAYLAYETVGKECRYRARHDLNLFTGAPNSPAEKTITSQGGRTKSRQILKDQEI